ncbi:MAG: hypothetical protein JW789_03700 [Candidatus Aenigmarchaeota archaeon]|nr:hypothetical protein [Candidatus Aenigmarchaeota archaeon]
MSNSMVSIPRLKIYGAGDFNRNVPYFLEGDISPEINNYEKKFLDIHKETITLGEQAGLWNSYLLSELGELDLGEAKNAIYSVFEGIGGGNFTNDACNYDGGIKLKKSKKTDRSVEWIIHPESFEKKNGIWVAKIGPDSEVKHIIIPSSGYVQLTCDGAFRPDTGTPFSTVKLRPDAVKSWIDAGYSPEFAEKAVTHFYCRHEGKGTTSVGRWNKGDHYGQFNLYAVYDPDYGGTDFGSLALESISVKK